MIISFFKLLEIFFFLRTDLTKENPLECKPLDGMAKTISFSFTFFLFKIFLFETIPTLNPARSNLSFAYIPGISAVSPPISLQPEISHPLKIPLRIFFVFTKLSLPTAM